MRYKWFNTAPKYNEQRVFLKHCERCGAEMFMRWKTAKYCIGGCNKTK